MIRRIIKSMRRRVAVAGTQQLNALPDGRSALRIAVQGLGHFGRVHASQLERSNYFDLVGISSRSSDAREVRAQFNCPAFRNMEDLVEQAKPDVLLIATPHLHHCDSILRALRNDITVICEKPLVVRASEVTAIQLAANDSRAKITVMSQTRFEPSYLKVRQLIDGGEIGQILRCNLTETFFRPDSYYNKDDWRGTWNGEGGGVLVNQAPHVLDRYRWLCGCPASILASCRTLRHDIEVEDSATLICNHDNGLQGTIHISTNEPDRCRLEMIGDRGSVLVEDGSITVRRWNRAISDGIRNDGAIVAEKAESLGGTLSGWSDSLLHAFYENFAESSWNQTDLMVSLDEAIDVVHMINAAQISEWQARPVTLPVCPKVHQQFLEEKQGTRERTAQH